MIRFDIFGGGGAGIQNRCRLHPNGRRNALRRQQGRRTAAEWSTGIDTLVRMLLKMTASRRVQSPDCSSGSTRPL